jgi:shikimate dehydrogenase
VPPAPSRLVLLGHPVAHSLSPAFQTAALRAAGIDATYEAMDVGASAFADVLRGLARLGAAGNVTVPHKERAAEVCDRLTPLAERVGAVNTWWVDDAGALVGDNTDVGGFDAAARALRERPWSNCRVALVGAGGSAAAALAAMERWPACYVAVWNRSAERARALETRFRGVAHAVPTLADAIARADLVVNATPLGLSDVDDLPVPVIALPKRAAVLDLVYRRGGTAWVRQARLRKHRAIDGLAMLIEQGALAFERWFGAAPDREAMWAAVGGRP